nr:hypothetical protein [Tanacetum cinerariifolium]
QVHDDVADDVVDDVVNDVVDADAEPTPSSPTPATTPPPQQVKSTLPPSPHQSPIAQPSSPLPQQPPSHDVEISMALLNQLLETGGIAELDADEDITLEEVDSEKDAEVQGRLPESQAQVYHLELEHAKKVLNIQETDEAKPVEVEEANAPRRRRGVIIQDPEEAVNALLSVQSKVMSKDKGKGILVEEPKPLKRQAQIEQDEVFQAAKKQKIDEEVEELKTHLQIILNDEYDVYTESIPLASKVPVVDYQIHTEHNKPYYIIIRADGTHQLFLSFISLLRNFNREDLEMLWKIIQERFTSLEPNNFSDDFLLNAHKTMFEKPNVEANI